jgi:hypothetical protein
MGDMALPSPAACTRSRALIIVRHHPAGPAHSVAEADERILQNPMDFIELSPSRGRALDWHAECHIGRA